MTDPVYLVHASVSPRRVAVDVERDAGGVGPNTGVSWLFLGRDYWTRRQWTEGLGPRFRAIAYGPQLQDVAMKRRQGYLDWIGALGTRHDSLAWWASRFAERNTQTPSVFHSLCYLEIALSETAAGREPLVVVVESIALMEVIAAQPQFNGRLRWTRRPPRVATFLRWVLRLAAVWTRYVVRAALELRDARLTARRGTSPTARSNVPRVLMHSCLDEEFFGEGGVARDRYFTILGDALRRLGYEVVVLPWLENVVRSRRQAFQWFRAQPGRYLIAEDHYTLGDYLWAAWVVLGQLRLPRGRLFFEGRDVTTLVRETVQQSVTDTGIARFVRYSRLVEKLHARGFRVDVFVDRFENMLTEKPQVLAFRKVMPEVMTVGYQHYLAPHPLLLNMFTTPEEARRAPHPDVIVCTSRFTADLLAREGFPAEKLRVGPSLRYLHLLQNVADRRPPGGTVLVVVPLQPGAAAELLHKLLEAFPKDERIRFLLKVHPMQPERIWARAHGDRLPSHIVRVNGDLSRLIGDASCGVVAGGTSGLELLLAGVPVVTVGRETDFELSPLGWFPEADVRVYSPAELRVAVLDILTRLETETSRVRAWAAEHRQSCVSPLTERTIRAFADPIGSPDWPVPVVQQHAFAGTEN